MPIAVTGASGHLGRNVVEELLVRGVPADNVIAGTRRVEVLADLARRGVQVRRVDFDDPSSLAAGFAGASRVLIVSGTDFGRRVSQHAAAAAAARDVGAELVAYTSAPHAETSRMKLAVEHRETERAIRELGVPFTFLRNGWYLEIFTAQIPGYLKRGLVFGSSRDGRISAAARADLAAAAAVVLTTAGHDGAVYELGGDVSFTMAEFAALVCAHAGKPVAYQDMTSEQYREALVDAGLPAFTAALYADTEVAIRSGALFIDSGDLAWLLGRAPVTPDEAVAAALP